MTQNSVNKAAIIYDRDYSGSTEVRGEVVPFFQKRHQGLNRLVQRIKRVEVLSMKLNMKIGKKKKNTRDHEMSKLFTLFLPRLQKSL